MNGMRLVERKKRIGLGLSILAVIAMVVGYSIFRRVRPSAIRLQRLRQFWADPAAHSEWMVYAGEHCGDAPFVMPTNGLIGFFWGDSFAPGYTHQGIDIFGPTGPDGLGQTPVVAAYNGYLTRLPDWRSSVIIRIPADPLRPERQIWMYYTHLADAEGSSFIVDDFPPGTMDVYVKAGTLLGYQGNYSADPNNPTGMHLHFSIVKDDGNGQYLNELEIRNTLDPSPYLGIEVNVSHAGDQPAVCAQ